MTDRLTVQQGNPLHQNIKNLITVSIKGKWGNIRAIKIIKESEIFLVKINCIEWIAKC